MTSKFEKVLNETLNLPAEAKEAVTEAWNAQLSEAKEVIASELREEFAQKFEYDKGVLVESMDKFLTDKITAELTEFAEDKRNVVAERVKYKTAIKEHTQMLETVLKETVKKEIVELRKERVIANENVAKLEGFLLQQLSEEIHEFHADKKALVEQKVKLIREGKAVLVEAKRDFLKKAATLVESNIESVLRTEITQYKEDIIEARENDFGRRIFESFVGEYMTSYLNESSEVKKLQQVIESKDVKIATLSEDVATKVALTESANSKLNAATDRIERTNVMAELLAPFGKEKRLVMAELLESVKTDNLEASFNKFLPAVLNETKVINKGSAKASAKVITEGVEVTGDRASVAHDSSAIDLAKMRKLAGL